MRPLTSSINVPSQPGWLRVACAGSVLAGLLLLLPATFYAYLNIHPPKVGPGDLYFGDGTGLVIAALFAVPAFAALGTGVLPQALWRRRSFSSAKVWAAAGAAAWLSLVAVLASFWFGG